MWMTATTNVALVGFFILCFSGYHIGSCYDDAELETRRHLDWPEEPVQGIRKEFRQLTTEEWLKVWRAFQMTRINIMPGTDMTEYDYFANLHTKSRYTGHIGAAFMPWHRIFLGKFTKVLRQYEPDVVIPYWDSILDDRMLSPNESAMWTWKYVGNRFGDVVEGLPAGWEVYNRGPKLNCDKSPTKTLALFRYPKSYGKLFNDQYMDKMFSGRHTTFTHLQGSKFEDMHNYVHSFVGGQMNERLCASNDLLFWLHHVYVDCVWEEFRQNIQTTDIYSEYPTGADGTYMGKKPKAHEPSAYMASFQGIRNYEGLRDPVDKCNFRTSRIHCLEDYDCGGRLLFCDLYDNKCKAKGQAGAMCATFGVKACDCSHIPHAIPVCAAYGKCICKSYVPKDEGLRIAFLKER